MLEEIRGIDIYKLISFCIFFGLFIIAVLYAWRADKKMINEIKNLPLDN